MRLVILLYKNTVLLYNAPGALIQSCDQLVNPDGSLTTAGAKAKGCITNGIEAAGFAISNGVPTSFVVGALKVASGLTGCGDVVNWNEIQSLIDANQDKIPQAISFLKSMIGQQHAPSVNTTSAQEPPIGQSFILTGTKSSQESPLPGHAKEQVVGILVPRTDNGVYSGVLTYTASIGVNVEIWTNTGNSTASNIVNYAGKPVAVEDLSPSGASGSVPFSGNAVLLHAFSPFTVSYTVNAIANR